MTNQTETNADLLRDLLTAFIDYPDELAIEPKDFRDAVYWSVQGHTDDHPKLVGKGGAHVKAIKYLLLRMGTAVDTVYSFELLDPEPGRRRQESPQKNAESYDPTPACDLLIRLLEGLGIGQYAVESKQDATAINPLRYEFNILVRDREDYLLLTAYEKDRDGQTIISALGTLFRAIANRDGVRIQLEVTVT